MKFLGIVVLLAAVFAAGFFGARLGGNGEGAAVAQAETAYERVMRTGVLRCAYGLSQPMVIIDSNTGVVSGLIVDLMEEVGAAMDLDIEWNAEVDWSQIPSHLQAQKSDAHCAGLWMSPHRGKYLAFSQPLFYTPLVTVVRADETRFQKSLSQLNDKSVTIAVGDNDTPHEIAVQSFPNAQLLAKPQLAGSDYHLMAVATGKADVTFSDYNFVEIFMKNNPGKLKIVHSETPIRLYGSTIAVDIHETALLSSLKTTLQHLLDSGSVQRLFEKYAADFDLSNHYHVAKPYQEN